MAEYKLNYTGAQINAALGKVLDGVPYNLLDNSYFADLVAQAGLNGAHGSIAYIADRWKSASATATLQSGYTTLSTAEKTGRIAQKLPDTLAGKTITAAAKVSGNSIVYCGVYYNQNSVSKSVSISVTAPNGIIAKSGVIPNDATDIEFRIYIAYTDGGGSCNVYWAALYEGSYTSDTLPAYVPKGYAAELVECMRYFERLKINLYARDTYRLIIMERMRAGKRITPTVKPVKEISSEDSPTVVLWYVDNDIIRGDIGFSSTGENYWYGYFDCSADL